MEFLLYIFIVATVVLIVLILHDALFGQRANVKARLEGVKDLYRKPEDEDVLSLPFTERVIQPLYEKMVGFLGNAMPSQIEESLKRNIAYAGSPGNLTVNRFVTIQIMLAIVMVGVFYLYTNSSGASLNMGLILVFAILGFMIPLYYIRLKSRKRQEDIQKALPNLLDLLYVSVEAGLGFDMALKRTIEKMEGPLSYEFGRALDDMNKGQERSIALRSIAHRTGVDDLSIFVSAVIQSENLGSNIANMLRVQSTSMRQKRSQRAEEVAAKIPVKMLFPLVFFMFPALFIVILGPAVIRIIEVFGGM